MTQTVVASPNDENMNASLSLSNISDLCILVVDDSPTSRHTIMYLLQKEGFNNIHEAEDGQAALEMTDEIKPDLVVLDIMMPNLDGYGYCEAVRQKSEYINMPILVQSGSSDKQTISKAFDAGATDYISKPISSRELAARARVHLENRRLIKQLSSYSERLEADLGEARRMQLDIIPSDADIEQIKKRYDIDISQHFRSSSELGGDFWGINPVDDDKFMVYVVDFSGHGVAASLNTFRLHTIIQNSRSEMSAVQTFMYTLNNKLSHLLPTGQYATVFCALVDTAKNTIEYSVAGSPYPMIFRQTNPSSNDMFLVGAGLPIGVTNDVVYDCFTTKYVKGDSLLMYSDALIESSDKNGNPWSEAKIFKKLYSRASEPCNDVMEYLVEDFDQEIPEVSDDLTMVFLKL